MSSLGGWCVLGCSLLFFLACGSSSGTTNGVGGDSSVTLGGTGGKFQGVSGGSALSALSAGSAGSAGSANTASGAAGTPTAGDAGGSGIESGSAGDAGADQGSATFAGSVTVGVGADSVSTLFSSSSAHFELPAQQPNCMTQTFGDCRVSICDPYPNSWSKADAGIVWVNFADKFNFEMYPTSDGYYADQYSPTVLPQGDKISVTADGGEVPAFSGSIILPEALRLSSPAAGEYGQLLAPSDADLELTFTGGAPGVRLGVDSHGSYNSGKSFSVLCSFASQAGRALIPKTALYYSAGSLSLYTYRAKSIPAGDYAIDLEAHNVVFDSEGVNAVNVILN